MKSVAVAASLLAGIVLMTPARAAAQDPETPPPPQAQAPKQQESAVTRESKAPSRSETRGEVRAPRVRDENSAPVNRAPERAGDRAVDRPVRAPERPVNTAPAAAPASRDSDQGARPRGSVRSPGPGDTTVAGRPVDRAVPRSSVPPPRHTTIVRNYPRYYPNYSVYYDPWGFGSFGVGYFYYSPWTWGPYAAYGYPYYPGPYGYDIGSVRIKVKERDAEVWVDGYYAGTVDDFDGIFQALKLDMGAYRIEVRKAGFESLTFDVRVQPERTITFRGEMKPLP
jgi:hypothetical protein